MENHPGEMPLPVSVVEMLKKICEEQSLPWPGINARRELALIGELESLQLLETISTQTIKTLDGFIIYMAKNARTASPSKSLSSSGLKHGSVRSSSNDSRDRDTLPSVSVEQPMEQSSPTSLCLKKLKRVTVTPYLEALGELEFRKAFLLLSYAGKKRLEDFVSVDEIEKRKQLPMAKFEEEIWTLLGKGCIEKKDRCKNLDWDSGRTYIYHCFVDPDGSYRFKGPYLHRTRNHLQRVLGDENVLLVKFAEEGKDITNSSDFRYQKIAQEGILVGLRRYHFFVFKDGGKEEKKKSPTSSPVKCYFVCMESNASFDETKPCILYNKTIREARCLFMHVHTLEKNVAKYMARFSLILSKTLKFEEDLASVHIERIEDILCQDEDGCVVYNEDGEPSIHTDGTGFISADLALKCPMISKVKYSNHAELEQNLDRMEPGDRTSEMREPPLLIQFRLFYNGCAVKGTFLINKKLPPRTVQIRPSMIKVEEDPELSGVQTANSLEIVRTSYKPRKSYLSRQLIALLSYGGVSKEYFMNILNNALEDAQNVHTNKCAALRVALKYGEMDDFLASRMILCGIPLDEPYLLRHLSVLMREKMKGLMGGKLPVSECYYLMGTADPTGLLNSDEVCVILENGQISGKVLVYKHPGLHFGDIHVLMATYIKEMESIVGNAKFAIFFPTKGRRSLADEIANSDFDGDMYWVSRNPQLLDNFDVSKPWERTCSARNACNRKPSEFSPDELENELFRRFLETRFQPSYTVGIAADSWLAFMDRLLTLGDECSEEKETLKKKMHKLIDIYYDALDAPKSGIKIEVPKDLKAEKFPHFMGRRDCYISKSILGLIYDKVKSYETENPPSKEVWKLSCFDGEVPQEKLEPWSQHYVQYRKEMFNALKLDDESKDESANEAIRKYKQILYGAANFEDSPKQKEEIFYEALAIYKVTYDYAKAQGSVGKCGFAWKVAGEALCKLHAMKQGNSILCSQSVLRELFN